MRIFFILLALMSYSCSAENIFRRSNNMDPTTMDVNLGADFYTCAILRDLYKTLVVYDDDARVVPAAALKWDLNHGGKEIIFHLRKDAKWSNGDPVTADDFVRSWRRVVTPAVASPYAEHMSAVQNAKEIYSGKKNPKELGVIALDPYRLKVILTKPTPHFISLLVHTPFSPMHISSTQKDITNAAKQGNLISNGAFCLKEWKPNEYVLTTKNPNYWNASNVQLDQVKYIPADGDTALNMYRADELDFVSEIENTKIPFVKKDEKIGKDFRSHPWYGHAYIGLNTTRAPFKDNPKLREALSLVTDREIIVNKVMHGSEEAAYSWIMPRTAHSKPVFLKFKDLSAPERLARAKQLFKEAGYSEKQPLKVEIMTASGRSRDVIATHLSHMWKKALGIETSIMKHEPKVYFQERKTQKNTQVVPAGLIGLYNDPQSFAECSLSKSGLNDFGFDSDEYDQLVEEASHTVDMKKRAALYAKAEELFLDSHTVIPLYYYSMSQLVKPYVKEYKLNLMGLMYSERIRIDHGKNSPH